VSLHVARAIRDLWVSGLFVVVPLNARFVLESWGGIHYAKRTLERLIREGDVEKAENKANRLTFGARSEVHLPFGGMATENSINILTFIDELHDVKDDARDLYDFLSEASHPNLFQNSYFLLAGPPLANWTNEKFRTHVHTLLDKTVSGLQSSISGIQADFMYLLKQGTEYIDSTV
jgi:hypothetical protein